MTLGILGRTAITALFCLFVLFLYGPTFTIVILSFQGPDGGLTFPMNCEIARNSDPLRAVFASNRDPSALCVSVSPYGPGRPGRGLGDDVRGRDRRYPARLFRAAPAD